MQKISFEDEGDSESSALQTLTDMGLFTPSMEDEMSSPSNMAHRNLRGVQRICIDSIDDNPLSEDSLAPEERGSLTREVVLRPEDEQLVMDLLSNRIEQIKHGVLLHDSTKPISFSLPIILDESSRLGIAVKPITGGLLLVTSIKCDLSRRKKRLPAERSGLRLRDIIIGVNFESCRRGFSDLTDCVDGCMKRTAVDRNKKETSLRLDLQLLRIPIINDELPPVPTFSYYAELVERCIAMQITGTLATAEAFNFLDLTLGKMKADILSLETGEQQSSSGDSFLRSQPGTNIPSPVNNPLSLSPGGLKHHQSAITELILKSKGLRSAVSVRCVDWRRGPESILYIFRVEDVESGLNWEIQKRYSECYQLQQRIEALCPDQWNVTFPRKTLRIMKKVGRIVQDRAVKLETYLRTVLYILTIQAVVGRNCGQALYRLQEFLEISNVMDCFHPPPIDDQRRIESVLFRWLNIPTNPPCCCWSYCAQLLIGFDVNAIYEAEKKIIEEKQAQTFDDEEETMAGSREGWVMTLGRNVLAASQRLRLTGRAISRTLPIMKPSSEGGDNTATTTVPDNSSNSSKESSMFDSAMGVVTNTLTIPISAAQQLFLMTSSALMTAQGDKSENSNGQDDDDLDEATGNRDNTHESSTLDDIVSNTSKSVSEVASGMSSLFSAAFSKVASAVRSTPKQSGPVLAPSTAEPVDRDHSSSSSSSSSLSSSYSETVSKTFIADEIARTIVDSKIPDAKKRDKTESSDDCNSDDYGSAQGDAAECVDGMEDDEGSECTGLTADDISEGYLSKSAGDDFIMINPGAVYPTRPPSDESDTSSIDKSRLDYDSQVNIDRDQRKKERHQRLKRQNPPTETSSTASPQSGKTADTYKKREKTKVDKIIFNCFMRARAHRVLLERISEKLTELEDHILNEHFEELCSFLVSRRHQSEDQKQIFIRRCVRRQVETALFLPIRRRAMQLIYKDIFADNMLLQEAVKLLQGYPAQFFSDRIQSFSMISNCALFDKISDNFLLPCDQVHLLTHTAKKLLQLFEPKQSTQSSMSADDFLPLFVYALVRSNPPNLFQIREIVTCLMDPHEIFGELGYFLTTLDGAVQYILRSFLEKDKE